MRKNQVFLFTSLMVLCTLAGCFVLGEVMIRLYHRAHDRNSFIWRPDSLLGYVHSPHNTFLHRYTEDKDITVAHQTNHFGFLGPEVFLKKSEGRLRILVMGDSFTEAMQVSREESFCGMLEQSLREDGIGAEVLNTGVSGYSPIIYYLYYKKELKQFSPDIVVVQLFANDVFEDHVWRAKSYLTKDGFPLRIAKYFERRVLQDQVREEGSDRGHQFSRRIVSVLMNKSKLMEYIFVRVANWQKKSAFNQEMIQKDEYGSGFQFYILDPEHKLSQQEGFLDKTWGQTQQYLLALKEEVEQSGARFMLVYIPMEAQLPLDVYGEHARLYVNKYAGKFFNGLLQTFAEYHRITLLDMLPLFEEQPDKNFYLNKDGHLTPGGHQIVARALKKAILQP